jgi:hypothetical protein
MFMDSDSHWHSRKAFWWIDFSAVLFCVILIMGSESMAGLYGKAGKPVPTVIGWLGSLSWWVSLVLCVVAMIVLIGKNLCIWNIRVKLAVAVATAAAVGAGVAVTCASLLRVVLQITEKAAQ